MVDRLKEKVILITGGNGLLGDAIIKRLKNEGAFCINLDIQNQTSKDLSTIHCDITDQSSINEAVKLSVNKYGKIDGLVNNAYPRTKDWGVKFESIPFESWKTNVDWQLNSYFYISQVVSAQMMIQQSGAIINMASVYGLVGPDFNVYNGTEMTMPAAYSAIKGALINFTKYLASYLGKYQIRVNAISPGGIFDNQPSRFVENYNNKVPLNRMGTPDDIAPSIAFLLSDDARYITGHNLIVDGGWTAI